MDTEWWQGDREYQEEDFTHRFWDEDTNMRNGSSATTNSKTQQQS